MPYLCSIKQQQNKNTMKNVSEIANSILEEMGGDANDICQGECTIFAMKLIDAVGNGQIVSNLSESMLEEISGYDVIEPECHIQKPTSRNNYATSHCWVKIDGKFYDAFNTSGVEDENYLEFVNNL